MGKAVIEKYFGEARKIRTISLDTNIINDVLFYIFNQERKILSSFEREYMERCKISYNLLFTFLCTRVKFVGIKTVRKELSYKGALLKVYRSLFLNEVKIKAEIRTLAKSYQKGAGLSPADAAILATVSAGNIDLFCSWNRKDIVKESTLEAIRKINGRMGLKMPLILTPEMFLERFGVTQERTILFTVSQIPKGFRPRFSYPT